MNRDAHAPGEREWPSEAGPRDFTPRLEELERRLISAVERRPAATLAVAALAGFTLGCLPARWTLAALGLGARVIAPLAAGRLDAALFGHGRVSNDAQGECNDASGCDPQPAPPP